MTVEKFKRHSMTALLQLLSGWPAQSVASRAPRVGIFRTGYWHLLELETATAIERVVTQLASENADVFDVDLPVAIDELSDGYHGL